MTLGTIGDVAKMLDVSRSRADQLSRQAGFPEPIGLLAGGRVWDLTQVEEWAHEGGRDIGEP